MDTRRRLVRVAGPVLAVMVPAMLTSSIASAGITDVIDRAASAATPAIRGAATQVKPLPVVPPVDNPGLAGCDSQVLQELAESEPAVGQWIVAVVPSTGATSGTLSIATVVNNVWRCTLAPTTARFGRTGIRPLEERRSGDGSTPSGVFPLGLVATPQGPVSFFGNSANPGTLGAYRRVQPGDCYGANPNTPGYGHWRVDLTTCTGDDELLQNMVQSYEHAVIIGANTEPNVSGDAAGEIAYASAIFLHRNAIAADGSSKPTSGCISIGHDQLVTALRTINPVLDPHFAIGTRASLLATA